MSAAITEREPIAACREKAQSAPVISPVTPGPDKGLPAQAASGAALTSRPALAGAIGSFRGQMQQVVEGPGYTSGPSPRRKP